MSTRYTFLILSGLGNVISFLESVLSKFLIQMSASDGCCVYSSSVWRNLDSGPSAMQLHSLGEHFWISRVLSTCVRHFRVTFPSNGNGRLLYFCCGYDYGTGLYLVWNRGILHIGNVGTFVDGLVASHPANKKIF